MKSQLVYLLGFLMFCFASQSSAVTYGFGCITTPASDCGSIASLLSLDVTDSGGGVTRFQINVASGDNAAVKDIYFDDVTPSLLDFITADLDKSGGTLDGGGVDFQIPASGGTLPGGNPVGFVSSFTSSAASPSGDNKNGIDNGEWLGISFIGTDFASILAALDVGDLTIGLHIGSLDTDAGSASFTTTSAVPVPAAFWLFGSALVGFIGMSRRTKVS